MTMEPILRTDELASLRLRELYRRYGYTYFKMSKFEEYDLYVRNKSFLVSQDVLTFTDTDGKLMALKPDVTLSIIKNTAPGSGALQKVYYNETVYRVSPTSHGYQEIMQTGLECVGELDLYAMGEVVELAAESMAAISGEYLLDLGHLGFVAGLLDGACVGPQEQKRLLGLLGAKNVPAITAAGEELNLPPQVTHTLCRLAALYGTPEEILPELTRMVRSERMKLALEELSGICGLLKKHHDRLRLDFSIVNDMNYYNGIIFRGYLPQLPNGILSGGRYDSLLQKMDKKGGAIGFAVYLNELERLNQNHSSWDCDVLLLYNGDTPADAVADAARELRQRGKSVRVERQRPEDLHAGEVREVKG